MSEARYRRAPECGSSTRPTFSIAFSGDVASIVDSKWDSVVGGKKDGHIAGNNIQFPEE